MSGRRRLPLAWTVIILHAVLVQVFTYAVRPALSYAVLDADGPAALLGLVGTAFAVPALALALPAGRFVDRIGERLIAVIGAVLLVASASVALLGLGSVSVLLVSALLLGVGHLLSVVSEQTAVANRSKEGGREGAFGLYTFAASIGQAIGPLLLALPHEGSAGPDLPSLLAIAAAVAVALTAVSALLRRTPLDHEQEPAGMLAMGGRMLREPGVLRALIASSLALASVDVTLAFWPALGAERMLPAAVISVMLTARALSTMASRAALPMLARWIPRRPLLAGSLAVSAAGLGLTALPLHTAALVTGAIVYGFAIGVCQPITMAWLTDAAPTNQRGMAMSLRLAGNRIGQSAVPAAVGALAPAAGALGILGATAVTLIVAAIVSLRAKSP